MKLTAKTRAKIPTSDFADPAQRKFPLTDKTHISSAMSYIRYASPSVAAKIRTKAKSMGIGIKAPKKIQGK